MSAPERYDLPNGKTLHRWTQDGTEWFCIAYDHGPFCRRCTPDPDGVLADCMENVLDGLMEAKDDPDRGLMFQVTEAGKARVRRMVEGADS